MNKNEKPASTTKKTVVAIGTAIRRSAVDTAKLGVKVAFITVVAVTTIGALKKVVGAE